VRTGHSKAGIPVTRRTRNFLCIWLIFIGLANYLVYGITYAWLEGDAKNGEIQVTPTVTGGQHLTYYVAGHFIRHGTEGKLHQVTRGQWIYSYIHSISLWATHAVILLAMLTLARPHIAATMRDSRVTGMAFVTIVATLIVVIFGAATTWFILEFLAELHKH
jgi:hypothetical protein